MTATQELVLVPGTRLSRLPQDRLPRAEFSDDPEQRYRYVLRRDLYPPSPSLLGAHDKGAGSRGTVNFIMLNPSTADETRNDATINRCQGFARSWGYRHVVVTNIFALRSTDPRALYQHPAPQGDPDNLMHIEIEARAAQLVVCAWSGHAALHGRGSSVWFMLQNAENRLHVLGFTAAGHPLHPLRLPKRLIPVPWTDLDQGTDAGRARKVARRNRSEAPVPAHLAIP